MSLKDFANSLAADIPSPIKNVLSILVHALLNEFEDLRGTTDTTHAQLLEAINRLEDRTNAAITGQVANLTDAISTLETRIDSMDPR